MIRRPPRSTQSRSSAASDVYKRRAGLSRLRYLNYGTSYFKNIADPCDGLIQTFDRQVFAEHSPVPIQVGIFFFPEGIFIRREQKTGLVNASMVLAIDNVILFHLGPSQVQSFGNRIFKNTRFFFLAVP